MSRGDGFPVADVDSSYMDDAKLRALWQRLRDPDPMARAVVLHASTLLASWRHGERVTVHEAAPVWLPCDDELIAALTAVKLLDRTGKIRPESWRQWFGAAEERRTLAREKGRRGGLAKAANAASRAVAQAEPGSSPALPDPTVPSEHEPLTPRSGVARINPRAEGTNPRARGTNPRAIAEARAAKARREANEAKLLVSRHNNGMHADDPDPKCPTCRERAAS